MVADRLPSLIQPVLGAAFDAGAVRGMPSSMAKKASSTAARRRVIRNFTLVPSLTCGTICPAPRLPGPPAHEAPHYALTVGWPFTTAAMRARKLSITYTRPAFPLSENLPQRRHAGGPP